MVVVVIQVVFTCYESGYHLPLPCFVDGGKVNDGVFAIVRCIKILSELGSYVSLCISVKPHDFIGGILAFFKACFCIEVRSAKAFLFAKEVSGFIVFVVLALYYREIHSCTLNGEPACNVLVFYVQVAESLKVACRKG